jgi:branched chain amino acid efflux pump
MPSEMLFGPFAGIMAIALATYFTRVIGFWAIGHVPMTLRLRRMLETLPGAIVVAAIVPLMFRAGIPGVIGIAMTFLVMLWRRNEFLAVAFGMGSVALSRAAGF